MAENKIDFFNEPIKTIGDTTNGHTLSVAIGDGATQADVDQYLKALVQIDEIHHSTHDGLVFTTCHIFEDIADDANADILLRTSATKTAHVLFEISVGGSSYAYLYESPTTSADGTPLSIINKNRVSSNTAISDAFYTPTVSAVGAELACAFVPGGESPKTIGGTGSSFSEWIIPVSTDALFRITNKSGSAETVSITLTIIEVEM